MGVGQLSESDAVDALRLPFYSSSHPTGSHGWRNQFDLGNPELGLFLSNVSYAQDPGENQTFDVRELGDKGRKTREVRGEVVSLDGVEYFIERSNNVPDRDSQGSSRRGADGGDQVFRADGEGCQSAQVHAGGEDRYRAGGVSELEVDYYDLVHARYVLLHLKEWEVVLKKLADSLKSGGWLFIEDPDLDEMMSDAATEDVDRAIIDRHFDAVRQMMGCFGMDMNFGSNTLKALKDNRLEYLKSESVSQVVFGGSQVAELFRPSVEMKDRLTSAGLVKGEEVDEFTEGTRKPTFLFRSMRTVFTLGRKPA